MAWKTEVCQWIQNLDEEIAGLSKLIEKIHISSKHSPQIAERLVNVTIILSESLQNILKKCEKLMKSSIKPEEHFENIKKEYFKSMENVENLYNTVDSSNLKPHYIFSTFASRKRSISSKKFLENNEKSTIRPQSISKSSSSKRIFEKKEIDPKASLKKIEKKLKNHLHAAYDKKISRLQEENTSLKTKIELLTEETRENSRNIQELQQRLELIEVNKEKVSNFENSPAKNRFLLNH